MDTPGVPERGTSYLLYGVGNRSINLRVTIGTIDVFFTRADRAAPSRFKQGGRMVLRSLFACSLVLAAFPLAAASLPKKGEPAISVQTQRSGGPIDPDQAKL